MKTALLLLASFSFASGTAAQNPIVLMTESYPPFSYQEPGGKYRGAGIDQIEIIMQEAQVPYTLEILPWARAITMAETQASHCVFAAARTAEREAHFKWVVPLFIDRNILVRHGSSKVSAATMDEAKQYTVGTHRADYTEGLLRSFDFQKIDLSSDFDTTLRKLLDDRIEMMPMSEGAYEKLRSAGTAIEKVIVFSEQHLGIACNRATPDGLIAVMQANLDKLIKDGIQTAILNRYGINQPK